MNPVHVDQVRNLKNVVEFYNIKIASNNKTPIIPAAENIIFLDLKICKIESF